MNTRNQAVKPKELGRTKLKLANIHTDPDTFQFRKNGLDPAHLKELTELVQRGVVLDPITVWRHPDNKKYLVIAGHHRRAAYRKANKAAVLSVKIFKGSSDEAQAYALESNGKNQIPITTEERQNGAWRLTCQWTVERGYPLSIAMTAKSAGISTSQVSNMRKVRSDLHDAGKQMPETWRRALKDGDDDVDFDYDEEWLDVEYAKLDAAMGAEITKAGITRPQVLGRLLACRLGENYRTVLSFAEFDTNPYVDDEDVDEDGFPIPF